MEKEKKKRESSTESVFDPIREIWVKLTPEERVRQAFVYHLIHQCGYPKELIRNEETIILGKVQRRCDTVVYSTQRSPLMIIEYKAKHVSLTSKVIEQIFCYNSVLGVPYVVITNGIQLVILKVGYGSTPTEQLSTIPPYSSLG